MPDKNWTIQNAENLYNVHTWSEGYVSINEKGHVAVHPRADKNQGIDLYETIQALKSSHMNLPMLIRFTDILNHRVSRMHEVFTAAIRQHDYRGGYTSLYPIKVNQQHSVVSEIIRVESGEVGLEAGSKPELMAVLGLIHSGGTIVCNGYKDREYIRLALIGRQLGHNIFIVIEKLSELELVLKESREMQVTPQIGLRVRLASIGAGNWQNSGGEKSKFGLSANQILSVVTRLKQENMLGILKMLHFHLGSQLVDINDISNGMQECARFYAELHALDVKIDYVDVGGGLGVDYEGRKTNSACSMNYDINSYAERIVATLHAVCEKNRLPHPHIFTESGRAMTAHHAVLVSNIIDREVVANATDVAIDESALPAALSPLWQIYSKLQKQTEVDRVVELYEEKNEEVRRLQQCYNQGELALQVRALQEQINLLINRTVQARVASCSGSHKQIYSEINEKMADKYFCNFSLFQSVPDVWGIDQLFPIMPLHRLHEKPSRRAVLEDITCDSDGRIDTFVAGEGIESSLQLHDIDAHEEYLLGFFMVGAYQEILGDMHNLFGDTDSVHVTLDEDGNVQFRELIQGDSVDSVLRYVHINSDDLLENYRAKMKQCDLDEETRQGYLDELASGLHGYTYLEE
ncbi:biosynthetic arginine decarboxylase [Kaarinaea lacus]